MANEKRLIDADALKLPCYTDDVKDEFIQGYREGKAYAILEVKALAPTVDAVEVVHGRWILQMYYGGIRKGMVARVICSECGFPNEKTNYCPNCGAKMDGDGDG